MTVLGAGDAALDPRSPCPAGGKLHKSGVCVLGWGWRQAGPGGHKIPASQPRPSAWTGPAHAAVLALSGSWRRRLAV